MKQPLTKKLTGRISEKEHQNLKKQYQKAGLSEGRYISKKLKLNHD